MKPWLYLLLIILAGCGTPKRNVVVVEPWPDAGAPVEWATSVRYPETVKQYQVGRRIDPEDESRMYEAHPFFRIENPAHWNLHPSPSADGGATPIIIRSLPNPATAAAAMTDETIAELNRQREITRSVMQQAGTLNHTLQGLTSALALTRSLAEQNQVLRVQLTNALQRLEVLEQQSRSAAASPPTKEDPL